MSVRPDVAFVLACVIVVSGAPFARAQTDAGGSTDPPPPATDPAVGAEPVDDDDAIVRLDPVVVTARKWREDTRDIPQSVTVIPGPLIEDAAIRSLSEAALFVPNTHFVEFTARRLSFPFIRGIGSGQGDPAVTTYIDGVPQLSISSTNPLLLDVERIEFLRGPQGTLYGRNSVGGLIHVFSKRPTNTPELRGNLEIGNFDLLNVSGGLSLPLIEDTLFVDVAGMSFTRAGYTINEFTGDDVDTRDTTFGRGQVLWTPDDANEVRFTIQGERTRDGGFVLSDIVGLRKDPFIINQDFQGTTDRNVWAPALTWSYSGDTFELTSISAYQSWDLEETADFDFTAIDAVRRRTEESLDGFTQEVRVASAENADLEIGDSARLRWQGGALFFTDDNDRSATNEFRPAGVGIFFPVPGFQRSRGDFDDLGIGVYGQATLTLGERLELGAGIRYDYERKKADIRNSFDSSGFVLSSTRDDLEESFDEWVPRFSASYELTDAITAYGLAARGFKAGGFNLSAPPGDLGFGPETSWTYEAGVKTSLFDDRLRLNAAYFRIDWSDMQLSQFDAVFGGFVTNAGESTSQGVELEAVARPLEGLDVFANFAYTDTEFDSFIDPYGADASGNRLPFAPETMWSIGAQYSFEMGSATELFVRGDYLNVGEFYYDAGNLESEQYEIANFAVGVKWTNVRIEAWLRNAFGDDYIPIAFQPSPVDPTVFVGQNGAPRTWGLRCSVRF